MKLKLRSSLAVAAVVALALAGCSKDSSDTTAAAETTAAAATDAAATDAAATESTAAAAETTAAAAGSEAAAGGDEVAAAQAVLAPYITEPNGIAPTEPLPSKAPKKTIGWMECDVPTCTAYLTPGFKAATAALGWDLKIFPSKSADPTAAMQQAIDAGVDYIAISGSPAATYTATAAAAKAKGIPVLSCYATDEPSV